MSSFQFETSTFKKYLGNGQNTGKMRGNTGKVREFCQSGKVGTMSNLTFYNRKDGRKVEAIFFPELSLTRLKEKVT